MAESANKNATAEEKKRLIIAATEWTIKDLKFGTIKPENFIERLKQRIDEMLKGG